MRDLVAASPSGKRAAAARRWLLDRYIALAGRVVRHPTDVIMLTHLLLYAATTVPSAAALLFWRFTWPHAVVHLAMQLWYMGAYNILMHQHIHQRGVLRRRLWLLDHTPSPTCWTR